MVVEAFGLAGSARGRTRRAVKLHRLPLLLRAYRWLPHRLLNQTAALLTGTPWPRPVVRAAVRVWQWRGGIGMADFQPADYATVDEFFLRELRPGARPMGEGLVCPADGVVVAHGTIEPHGTIEIKGQTLDFARLLNGQQHDLPVAQWHGGQHFTVFLTPDGYHHVHSPVTGTLRDVRRIRGRFFPQNADALQVIPKVYERNERAVVRIGTEHGEFLLIFVGASFVGGIELAGVADLAAADKQALPIDRPVQKGERLGHFRFGSTVVVLCPPGAVGAFAVQAGQRVQMGANIAEFQP